MILKINIQIANISNDRDAQFQEYCFSDPFVVVYSMDYSTERFKEIGRTEIGQNDRDYDFTTPINVPYIFNDSQVFRMDVYDSDKQQSRDLSKHDYIGSATFNLAEIIHENRDIQPKKLLDKSG